MDEKDDAQPDSALVAAELLLPFGVVRYEEASTPFWAVNVATLVVYALAAAAGLALLLSAGDVSGQSSVGGLGPAGRGETVTAVLPMIEAAAASEDGRYEASLSAAYLVNYEACPALWTRPWRTCARGRWRRGGTRRAPCT